MTNTNEKFDVVIVGSCVEDLISYVHKYPAPGENVIGTRFAFGFGGKGANQAVMAARLGAKVAMVGKVGKDIFAQPTIENFHKNGVNADDVGMTDKANTATANIVVEDSGQNSIVVVLGANLLLNKDDVRKSESKIANSKVVVCQGEIEDDVTLEALKIGKKHGVTTILNPAPSPPNGLSDEFYKYADILCPNEHEAEHLTGFKLDEDEDVERALKVFLDRGVQTIILTLGSKGCIFATKENPKGIRVDVEKVKAVDTTGAGDAFVGSLAYYTACYPKMNLADRIRRACRIASISVQAAGTQTSYPEKEKLPKDLFD